MRATSTRSTRHLLLAAVAVVVLAACADDATVDPGATGSPSASATASTPPATASPTGTSSPAATSSSTSSRVALYWLGETHMGPRLYREFRTVPTRGSLIESAVDGMLDLAPMDPDYSSLWPAGTQLLGVRVSGDLATVDFSREATTGTAGSSYEQASIQQLVHTVTAANTTVRRVQIHVEGRSVETLWGHVNTRNPFQRGPQMSTLGAVWVIDPQQGASTSRALRLRGDATVFEATVTWDVIACASESSCTGRVLRNGFATASTGGPERGTWAVDVTLPPGTAGWVMVRAWESSAEDGRPLFRDTKVVRVR